MAAMTLELLTTFLNTLQTKMDLLVWMLLWALSSQEQRSSGTVPDRPPLYWLHASKPTKAQWPLLREAVCIMVAPCLLSTRCAADCVSDILCNTSFRHHDTLRNKEHQDFHTGKLRQSGSDYTTRGWGYDSQMPQKMGSRSV